MRGTTDERILRNVRADVEAILAHVRKGDLKTAADIADTLGKWLGDYAVLRGEGTA